MEWVTVNGRHIPVDDEEKKKRQIDFNKKEADKRNAKTGKSSKTKKKQLSKKFDELENRYFKEKK